jgi:hypothetical protein
MKKTAMIIMVISVWYVTLANIPKHSATYYEAIKPEVQKAQRKGAWFKVIYHIVDDEGHPLKNQQIRYTCQNDFPRKRWEGHVTTDKDGIAVVQDKAGSQMTIGVYDKDHYVSWDKIRFLGRDGVSPLVKDGKWQPYGEERTLVVKRKKNPVVMNWHSGVFRAPATNEWVGLDLECGQWCKPYGGGKFEDIKVKFSGGVIDHFTWDTVTEISFTNVPYAGYYTMSKDLYSDMKSCYSASTSDVSYVNRTMAFISHGARGIPPNRQTTDKLAGDKYIVFRTRCVVDDEGRLVSAHYGKICGEMGGGLLKLLFRGNDNGIYFNPTPNDTNLEDMETINCLKLLGR